ncbi:AbrB family transcriptional regulator [Candidatus Bathyarchaeota archaeon]|nr:MAG: AbrB family transcriptional regulator [Candidatus Bathyarchaeota archaeon]
MKVKVTRNYQVSIPAEIRRLLNIKLGDVLEVRCDEEKGEIILRKVEERRRTLRAGRGLTPEEIEELIQRGLGDNL